MTSKTILSLGILLASCSGIHAQFENQYGNISQVEINLKECAFDVNAPAVKLVDEGMSDFALESSQMTFMHIRIKVLKDEGKKYADVSIPFRSENDAEYIDELQAMVVNFDDAGHRKDIPVDKKLFYTKKINKYRSEVSFAFPEVRAGSILEYSYRLNTRYYSALPNWLFQGDMPVYRSSYKLKMIPGREVTYLIQYNPKYDVSVVPNKILHSIYFEMKNIPALTDEPYMDASKDYVQKVIFQTTRYDTDHGSEKFMSNWSEVNKELYSRPDFGRQLKIKVEECEDFVSTLTGMAAIDKMKAIHGFVVKNTLWDGSSGVITEDGIKSLWKKKVGTAAEINLLLTNMLQNAGLEAYPMLVSLRGNGKINKATPFINQFNSVFAVVVLEGKKYYLDATDKYTPAYLTPYSILNTSAFIANNKNGGVVDIEEPEYRYKELINIDAKVSEDGIYSGNVMLLCRDYARSMRLKYLKDDTKETYIDDHILGGFHNVKIEDFKTEDEQTDSLPLKQMFQYNTHIQNTGDYSFLNLNLFTGFETNPFILNDRFSTINFGFKKSIILNCKVLLPPNYKLDEIPKNIRLKNQDGSVVFVREIFTDEKTKQLVARIRVDINKSLFTVDEYGEVKEFYKKMIDLMNEQVVLKKI